MHSKPKVNFIYPNTHGNINATTAHGKTNEFKINPLYQKSKLNKNENNINNINNNDNNRNNDKNPNGINWIMTEMANFINSPDAEVAKADILIKMDADMMRTFATKFYSKANAQSALSSCAAKRNFLSDIRVQTDRLRAQKGNAANLKKYFSPGELLCDPEFHGQCSHVSNRFNKCSQPGIMEVEGIEADEDTMPYRPLLFCLKHMNEMNEKDNHEAVNALINKCMRDYLNDPDANQQLVQVIQAARGEAAEVQQPQQPQPHQQPQEAQQPRLVKHEVRSPNTDEIDQVLKDLELEMSSKNPSTASAQHNDLSAINKYLAIGGNQDEKGEEKDAMDVSQ
jgi:hypothetical protein